MTKQRKRFIALTATILGFIGIFFSVIRPPEEPRWQRHLEQYGGEFHRVPGKSHISVCYVELRFDYGPQSVLKPALYIRNERWTSNISRMTVRATDSGLAADSYTLIPASSCSPVDWDSLRAVNSSGIRIGHHAYTLVLCDSLPAGTLAAIREPPNTEETSINLELVIDSDTVTIDDINAVQVNPAMIGLTRVVFDMASFSTPRTDREHNKAWLPTGCPPRVESAMTIPPSTMKSERALRQPVAAL